MHHAATSLYGLCLASIVCTAWATTFSGDEESGCHCSAAKEESEAIALPMAVSLPVVAVLVALSGLFSGLTLGLMGLDQLGLQAIENGGPPELAKCAKKIAPVRKNGNLLLCTLLLGNVAVNSALSILTAEIASGLIGFLVSTVLIVLFGEILPQAICSRYALQVGARTVEIVKVLICLFFIVTKPLSLMLDKMLGRDIGVIYTSTELVEMMKLQIEHGAMDKETGETAKQVVEGALSFRNKLVRDIMIPLEDVYMLSKETRLGYAAMRQIFESGFSRVPVYGEDKHDYRGMLNTKDLMLADPEDEMRLDDFIGIFDRKVAQFRLDTKLVDALDAFKKGKTHMALVREPNVEDSVNPRVETLGLITLEDVMEEILQEEIVDETDVWVDVENHVAVNDGRERRQLNLGVFNPVWRMRDEQLSAEEVSAIAAHLHRKVFAPSTSLALSIRAIEWLVRVSKLTNKSRCTPPGVDYPDDADIVYKAGAVSDVCVLVLQGRFGLRLGRDQFRCEAGAFTVLGIDALCCQKFAPDFTAFLATSKVRYLLISRSMFQQALKLESDADALTASLTLQRAHAAGESIRSIGDSRDVPPRAHSSSTIATCVAGSPRSARSVRFDASSPKSQHTNRGNFSSKADVKVAL
mmetsp:Transcript_18208/g.42588  ORF Transcript_18208/g.42588 Transcript_18208/m.42588 type:complete len:638 (+) Transcript_18208:121-2034(+)